MRIAPLPNDTQVGQVDAEERGAHGSKSGSAGQAVGGLCTGE